MKRNLNFSYSLYQSLYWMSACFVYSYTRVFLQKLGFSASVAGAELAFSSILSVLLQPWIASALGKRKSLSLRSVITGALVLSLFCGGLLLVPVSMGVLAVFFLIAATMTLTVQPFINSVGFGYINEGASLNYSASRGVASLAYAGISKILAAVSELETGRGMLLCYLLMTAATLAVSLVLAQGAGSAGAGLTQRSSAGGSTGAFIKRYPGFSLMLLGQLLIFFSITASTAICGTLSAMPGVPLRIWERHCS